jgi:hypothetical protein
MPCAIIPCKKQERLDDAKRKKAKNIEDVISIEDVATRNHVFPFVELVPLGYSKHVSHKSESENKTKQRDLGKWDTTYSPPRLQFPQS